MIASRSSVTASTLTAAEAACVSAMVVRLCSFCEGELTYETPSRCQHLKPNGPVSHRAGVVVEANWRSRKEGRLEVENSRPR